METQSLEIVPVEGRSNGPKFTEEEREEIRMLVRRAMYSHIGVTAGRIARGLREQGWEVSRELARWYMAQCRSEDAEAERVRAEIPDIFAIRSEHRQHRAAVFNAAMQGEQFAQANRALDALAALDGLTTARTSVTVTGRNDGPIEMVDPTRMSDDELRARLALARAEASSADSQTDRSQEASQSATEADWSPIGDTLVGDALGAGGDTRGASR